MGEHTPEKPPGFYEVIVIGGGMAGLSAALVLGRCRRRVLLIDAGRPRNRVSHHVYGFLTREGTPPLEMLRLGREELRAYPCVEQREGEVVDVSRLNGRFHLTLKDYAGTPLQCRRLLLATGMVDELPPLPGIEAFYGSSVFVCPICNGWEARDKPMAVYGVDRDGAELAMELLSWSRDMALCTHGARDLPSDLLERLRQFGVRIFEQKIVHLTGKDGQLECIHFEDGAKLGREVLFFSTPQHQQSGLPASLGCKFEADSTVRKQGPCCESSNIPGLFVAGNASACGGAQLAIVAAGEGAEAAHAIHCSLAQEDFDRGRWEKG
jgi:thioredoxin reductase